MSTFEEIARGLGHGCERATDQGYQTCCPAHHDNNSSLTIGPGRRHPIIWHCQHGCSREAIKAALLAEGYVLDGKPDRPAGEPVSGASDGKSETLSTAYTTGHAELDEALAALIALPPYQFDGERKALGKRFDISRKTVDGYVDAMREAMRQEEVAAEVADPAELLHEAETKAARLLDCDDILGAVVKQCEELGVIGETHLIRLTYLSMTSRLFRKIVSEVVKGPSSAGKSFVVLKVVSLFPDDAYMVLTSMSEHFLIYDESPLSHRMMIVCEAPGIKEGFLAYIVRTLISEGKLLYGTVEKDDGKLAGRMIVREGPTGVITTTIELNIDAETETRCFSITADDSPEQTKAIMLQAADMDDDTIEEADLSEWHAFQTYLALQPIKSVVTPFYRAVAELIPPSATRLRRDIKTLKSLIQAHALLQKHRQRDQRGRIVADLIDYGQVRRSVNALMSDAAGMTVPKTVQETRKVVAGLLTTAKPKTSTSDTPAHVSVRAIATAMELDYSTTWRRVRDAINRGRLKNLEDKAGRHARIVLGDKIDVDVELLPSVAEVKRRWQQSASG